MNFRDGVPLGTNEKKSIPVEYEIIQAYPNPFNPSTTLKIRLPQNIESKDVTLHIFNILGQLVKTFEVSDLNDQQDHHFIWNARDNNGKFVSSGVYLAVLTTPAKRYSVKLLLMK
jgi:flagellar hook assembly protein FlgD